MNLTQYLKQARGNATKLAGSLGIPPAYLSQMSSGYRAISPMHCVAIEKATEGQVTRQEMRPDDWHLIWPEIVPPEA